jgi:RNA polymerase sigma factor (TIGR02999 family)
MRRILIDSARARRSQKRGGDRRAVEMPDVVDTSTWSPDLLMDVDDALSALQVEDPAAAAFVKLRIYAGLNVVAAGELLGMSRATAYRTWEFARSWIAVRLANDSR